MTSPSPSPARISTDPKPAPVPSPVSLQEPARESRNRRLRLHKHADYQRVYQSSRKQFSATMTWFAARREAQPSVSARPQQVLGTAQGPRVGLTAGKVLGKAHERNRIKRRMRELVRRHADELPDGLDLILHPRRSAMTMDFGKLDAEVLRIFRQAAAQFKDRVQVQARSSSQPGTKGAATARSTAS